MVATITAFVDKPPVVSTKGEHGSLLLTLQMFLRHRRVGRYIYTEALESYRSGGRIRHRCAVRWHAHLTLAQAIAEVAELAAVCRRWVKYYDAVQAGAVPPKLPKHRKHAAEYGADSRRLLGLHTARLAKLRALAKAHPEFRDQAPRAGKPE